LLNDDAFLASEEQGQDALATKKTIPKAFGLEAATQGGGRGQAMDMGVGTEAWG